MDDAASTLAEEIFCAALELEAEKRPAFLAARCDGDESLRRMVEELLAAHFAAGSSAFLENPLDTHHIVAALRATAPPPEEETSVGDRYRLLERIGEGGMGVVWRAEQTIGVQRIVAVKVLKAGLATAEALTRFEIERQALARMSHPNIAKVLDAGTTSAGRPFFVMEFVPGKSLIAFCDEQRLAVRERLRLFQQVCDAVQHAHQKGIIHRDLKPGNILVEQQGGAAVPKVIDFGLAKTLGAQAGDGTVHTMVGALFGTPAYVAPEQTAPSAQDIDTRADIFSLGVLLYELLTGTTPVPRDELARLSLDAAFAAVGRNDPIAPSLRLKRLGEKLPAIAAQRRSTPEALVASARGDLDWITLRALEKERRRRYQTASEFAADIERHLADEPVWARPPSASYRVRKFVRRHRLAVGLAAGVMLASVVGAGVSLALMMRARASEAELAAFAAFLTDDVLATARPKGVPGGLGIDATIGEALVAANANIPQRFYGRPRAEALTRHAVGVTFDTIGQASRAVTELERAWELRRQALGDTDPRTLATMSALGQAYLSAGRLKHAIAFLSQAVARQEAALGPGHADTVNTMIALGKAYSRADDTPDLARAIAICEQALERATRTFGPDSEKRYATMVTLGGAYFLAGRFTEAIELHEKALANFRTAFSSSHPYTLGVMSDLALDYMAARQLRKAIDLQREVLARQREQLGAEHPTVLATLSSLAYNYVLQGDHAAAEAAARDCLARRKATLGENHPDTITIAVTLGQSLLGQQRFAEAAAIFRAVVAEREKTSANHWRLHLSRLFLGEALLGQGDSAQAAPLLEDNFHDLKAGRAKIPVWSAGLGLALQRLAESLAARGDTAAAERWQDRHREWREWDARRRAELEAAGRAPSAAARRKDA